jgi:hypothetical protein
MRSEWERISYEFVVGNAEGKRELRRPRQRWEDVLNDVKEIGLVMGEQVLSGSG